MKLVVTGFASLDYAVRLDRPSQADRTATILSRPTEWPRLGGSPAYVAAALAAEGAADATPVTWIGDDGDGETYLAALVARGLSVAGVGRRPGRTPICILAYEPAGGCHCLYDPGLQAPAELDSAQRALIAAAVDDEVGARREFGGEVRRRRAAIGLDRPDDFGVGTRQT